MRLYFFIIVAIGLLLTGCVKTEVEGDSGVHIGFIERNITSKETMEPAQPVPALIQELIAKPLPPAPELIPEPDVSPEPIVEPGSPLPAEPVPQLLPDPVPPIVNETHIVEVIVVNETNITTTVNETNTTAPEPEPTPPAPADPDNPLGFPIRIDANRYYQDGAVPCHNGELTQCVHIHVGQENCGTNCRLDPEAIMVPIGTTVEWGNHDSVQHQVIAQDESFGSFPLDAAIYDGGIYPNYFFSHFTNNFTSLGEHIYHGEVGSTLIGTVIVVSSLS